MELMCNEEYVVEKIGGIDELKIYRTFKTEEEAMDYCRKIQGDRAYKKIIEEIYRSGYEFTL